MQYRAEIDGLRALAVVPVILFHAGFEVFRGGYVGVDVFFVISGYLITTILIEDIEKGRFSLLSFYERRARRILPALFCIMLLCIPFSWMWMLPKQMEDFSQSLVAVTLFISNFLFWRESDYFGATAEEKPLLHTWSLAVEEQYYLLFPIFLFLAWRFGRHRVFWMIAVFAAISLALSEWGWRNQPIANFYLAPTRAWELFAGSITAFIVQKRGVQSNNLLSCLGLVAVLFAVFAYDEKTPFPSLYTIVPVAGVVLLILFAAKDTLAARVLSVKLCVGIGLISYSAYLWHQPLFAFARIRMTDHPPLWLMGGLSALTFGLAFLTWKFVETPFRDRTAMGTRTLVSVCTVGSALMIAVGTLGVQQNGFENRLSAWQKRFVEDLDNRPRADFRAASERRAFAAANKPKILIIGDSYAKDLYEGLQVYFGVDFSKLDVIVLPVPRRCKNVLADTGELFDAIAPGDVRCFNREGRIGTRQYDDIIAASDLVLVRSLWDVLPTQKMPQTYDHVNDILPGRVAFIGPQFFGTVRYKNLPQITAGGIKRFSEDAETVQPYTNLTSDTTSLDLASLAVTLMADRNYFPVQDYFCEDTICEIVNSDGLPITSDGAHLTRHGELLMMTRLFENDRFRTLWNNAVPLDIARDE